MPWMLLAAAALSAAKYAKDSSVADKQRKVQAETTRYSPWTGLKADAPSQPNLFNDLMQGGTTAMMLGQGMPGSGTPNFSATGGSGPGLGADTALPTGNDLASRFPWLKK